MIAIPILLLLIGLVLLFFSYKVGWTAQWNNVCGSALVVIGVIVYFWMKSDGFIP